jgi:ubiquinone/menaquinone biosynthesis C-methylase UbiE
MWAHMFAASRRMNRWQTHRFSRSKEWSLIQRNVISGGRVLDAGCGFGEWVCFLRGKGYLAQGLDFSATLIARLQGTYPHFDWQHGDVRHMPYADATFDAVISWGVIEHDECGPAEALREFRRVLKPGGIMIITVPIDSPAQRHAADYLYHRGSDRQAFFQYFMTAEELTSHVSDAGFQIIDEGVLPNTVLQLASPRLAARLRGLSFRLANFVVSTCLSWMTRYCVMRYSVAVNGSDAPDAVGRRPGVGQS